MYMFIYLLTYMYSKYVPDVIGGCLFEIKLGQPDCFYCQRGEYHKMTISIVNMTMHNFIKFGFPVNFQTKSHQMSSFSNGQHHAFFADR